MENAPPGRRADPEREIGAGRVKGALEHGRGGGVEAAAWERDGLEGVDGQSLQKNAGADGQRGGRDRVTQVRPDGDGNAEIEVVHVQCVARLGEDGRAARGVAQQSQAGRGIGPAAAAAVRGRPHVEHNRSRDSHHDCEKEAMTDVDLFF